MKNNIDLEIYIRKIMHELGFKPNLMGYEVFKDAIISILENEGKLGSVKLYKDLGEKRGISGARIERELRNLVQTRVKKQNDLSGFIFRNEDTLVLSECLALVAEYIRITMNKDNDLDKKISHVAYSVGIPFSSKGYIYFKDAMKELISNSSIPKLEVLYYIIGNKHSSTINGVERCIRHAIEVASNEHPKNEISNYLYQNNRHLTNSEFLSLTLDYTKLIDKSNEKTIYDTINISNENNKDKESLDDMSLNDKILFTLVDSGIPADIKGYYYLRDAIIYSLSSDNPVSMTYVYKMLADAYSTTPSKVERAMRYAILVWSKKILESNNLNDINKFIKSYGIELANSEFIALVAEYIKVNSTEYMLKKAESKSRKLIKQD